MHYLWYNKQELIPLFKFCICSVAVGVISAAWPRGRCPLEKLTTVISRGFFFPAINYQAEERRHACALTTQTPLGNRWLIVLCLFWPPHLIIDFVLSTGASSIDRSDVCTASQSLQKHVGSLIHLVHISLRANHIITVMANDEAASFRLKGYGSHAFQHLADDSRIIYLQL